MERSKSVLAKIYVNRWNPNAPVKLNSSNAARMTKELYTRIKEAFENCPKKHSDIRNQLYFYCNQLADAFCSISNGGGKSYANKAATAARMLEYYVDLADDYHIITPAKRNKMADTLLEVRKYVGGICARLNSATGINLASYHTRQRYLE